MQREFFSPLIWQTLVVVAVVVSVGVAFLVTIDTTTGTVTNVGATVDGLDAIAFAPLAVVAPVPALSERGMAILGLIIMGSALVLQRRV